VVVAVLASDSDPNSVSNELMGSADPNADSMPHQFAANVPSGPVALNGAMNAYTETANSAGGLMSAHIVQSFATNIPSHGPLMGSPIVLEVLRKLQTVKQAYQAEADGAISNSSLSIVVSSNRQTVSEADDRVENLRALQAGAARLRIARANYASAKELLQLYMQAMGSLTREEGMAKAPLMQAIGRTSLTRTQAIRAKQVAVSELSHHPGFAEEEMKQLLASYDELEVSLRKQLESLNEEANSVLSPLHLKMNVTQHNIDRVRGQVLSLRAEVERLSAMDLFSEDALEMALVVQRGASAHLGFWMDLAGVTQHGYDERAEDRSAILEVVDELMVLMSEFQKPQE